jgi:hypothetical protein
MMRPMTKSPKDAKKAIGLPSVSIDFETLVRGALATGRVPSDAALCELCRGTGKFGNGNCPECRGKGRRQMVEGESAKPRPDRPPATKRKARK